MSRQRFSSRRAPLLASFFLAAPLSGALLSAACGGGPKAPAQEPSSSASASASETPAADTTPAPDKTQPSTPPAPTSAPAAASAEPTCIGGQIIMGACVCDRGKSVDSTGHCVLAPCPSFNGGAVFHDPTTGQCKECSPGSKPTKAGTCVH